MTAADRRRTVTLLGLLCCLLASPRLAAAADGAAAEGKVMQPDLVLVSPRDYQVIQRDNTDTGVIRVSGRSNVDCDSVEVMIAGKGADGDAAGHNWQAVDALDPVTRGFTQEISFPAGGWYAVSVARNSPGSDRPSALSPPTRSSSRRLIPSHKRVGRSCNENMDLLGKPTSPPARGRDRPGDAVVYHNDGGAPLALIRRL